MICKFAYKMLKRNKMPQLNYTSYVLLFLMFIRLCGKYVAKENKKARVEGMIICLSL